MNNESKYIIIKTNENNSIISFFDDYFSSKGIIKNEYLVYELKEESAYKDYTLKEMIDNIKIDFGIDINIFESGIISKGNEKDLEVLIALYEKYNKKAYINISILADIIFSFNIKDLNVLKKVILNVFNENKEFYSIANSMFKNDLNVSKSANDVYMHRNTLINKINIMSKKLGLDIQRFEDAFILKLILSLND